MRIGEVARRSGISARMLRHYDALGLVRPTGRTAAGYRDYSDADLRRLLHVESLRSLGLTLREIGRALDDPGFTPSDLVEGLVARTEQRLARERELLARLRRVGAADPEDWQDALRIVALLHGLGAANAGERQRAALASAHRGPAPVGILVEAVLAEDDPNVAGALRWALARSGDEAVPVLAAGLDSDDGRIRTRAVETLAELSGAPATAALRRAVAGRDPAVRRRAAVALGERGVPDAVPTLIDMVAEGRGDAGGPTDVDAADALAAVARGPEGSERDARADRIAAGLLDRLHRSPAGSPARQRLAQALADIPGSAAAAGLTRLSRDEDRTVAGIAAFILDRRGDRGGPSR